MDHTISHAFDDYIRYAPFADEFAGGVLPHIYTDTMHVPWIVDTGKTISGDITEDTLPGNNTRLILLDARTMSPVNILGRLMGSSYMFRNVPDADMGYYVMGIDLDSVYSPVCEGPLFPVVTP